MTVTLRLSLASRKITKSPPLFTGRAPAPVPGVRGASSAQEDEAAELEAAMMMSLAETSGGGGAAAQLDSGTLDEVMAMQRSGNMDQEEELEMALRLSQQQVYFSS